MQFYEELSDEYDAMTQFETRFEKEKDFFMDLKKEYGFRRVLDAGCGTGFHSILMAKLGLEVTGVDSSSEMLKRAMENATTYQVDVQFQEGAFQELSLCVEDTFDAVFVLGNVLPHLLTEGEIVVSFKNFHTLLNEGGILVIQNLNYDRIVQRKERIIGVKKHAGSIFVRFYDFNEERVKFNILILKENGDGYTHNLISTELKPLYQAELLEWLGQAGFRKIRSMGNTTGDEYSKDKSKDLIVIAKKSPIGDA